MSGLRSRRRGLLPRAGGAVALLALALFLWLFAPVTLLRYLAMAILLALLLAYLHAVVAPRRIGVVRTVTLARGSRFQEVRTELVVTNGLRLPIAPIRVSDTIGSLHADRTVFYEALPARGSVRIEYGVRSHERGEYALGPVQVSGTDPLGLFRWERSFDGAGRLVVYPDVYRIELEDTIGLAGGSLRSIHPFHEDPTRYRSVREYVAGDEIKHINWKATARMGKLLTTEHDRTLYSPIRILLNLCRADFPDRRRDFLIERAVETAASLAVSYARLGQPVGLIAPLSGESGSETGPAALVIPERSGWTQAEQLLEALARIRPVDGSLPALVWGRAARVPPGTRLLLVGPDLSPEQVQSVLAIRKRGVTIEHVKVISATEPERNRDLSGILRVTIIEEVGHDIVHR